jgi:hypothetical protein
MRSKPRPRLSESAKLVPGNVTALTVSVPSLNSGKNARPARESAMPATIKSSADGMITNAG